MIKNFLSKNIICQNKMLLKNYAKNFSLAISFGLVALLFSVLISHLLYQPKKMVKRGFEVEIKAQSQDISGIKVGELADVKKSNQSKTEVVDIATMIKNADIDAGAKVFKKCSTCHSVDKNGGNKVGPNLYAIVGKNKASVAGFSYSNALKAKDGSWTIEDLNQWLTKPKDFVPGTKMGFAGLKKDKDRANVIAYLKQQK
jgi:cytochrome c